MKRTKTLKWWSSPRTLLRNILMLDDTPHSIALGTAVGMCIGLTPTVGIQMMLVMLFAVLVSPFFRFNRVAALLTVYVSNPVTMVPIYWFLYEVGTFFVDGNITYDKFASILTYDGFSEWWGAIVTLFVDVGTPLIVGTIFVASVGGIVTYPVMRLLLRSFRETVNGQRLEVERPGSSVQGQPAAEGKCREAAAEGPVAGQTDGNR